MTVATAGRRVHRYTIEVGWPPSQPRTAQAAAALVQSSWFSDGTATAGIFGIARTDSTGFLVVLDRDDEGDYVRPHAPEGHRHDDVLAAVRQLDAEIAEAQADRAPLAHRVVRRDTIDARVPLFRADQSNRDRLDPAVRIALEGDTAAAADLVVEYARMLRWNDLGRSPADAVMVAVDNIGYYALLCDPAIAPKVNAAYRKLDVTELADRVA